jgi:HD-like signal output (HDOD) protein
MSAIENIDHRAALEAVTSRINEIAVLPHAVCRVLEISGSSLAAATELERAIVVDPGFAARLLERANCAFYGLPKRVSSVRDAVMFLGFKTVRQIALTVGFFDMFVGKTDKESLRRRGWWRLSVDTAITCKWLATETGKIPSDEAYTIGLLHQIGKTVLDRSTPGGYDRVETLIDAGVSVTGAEMNVFGCTHIEVGMLACQKWGFPNAVIESMNYLNVPAHGNKFSSCIAAVALSNHMAKVARGAAQEEAPQWALEALGLEADIVDRAMEMLSNTTSPM